MENGKYLEYDLDGNKRLRHFKDKSKEVLVVLKFWLLLDHIFVFSQVCITVYFSLIVINLPVLGGEKISCSVDSEKSR